MLRYLILASIGLLIRARSFNGLCDDNFQEPVRSNQSGCCAKASRYTGPSVRLFRPWTSVKEECVPSLNEEMARNAPLVPYTCRFERLRAFSSTCAFGMLTTMKADSVLVTVVTDSAKLWWYNISVNTDKKGLGLPQEPEGS